MQVDTIVERLQELMEQENIEADEKSVKYIAKCADGAMRDALSLLDQCISFHFGEKLTYDNVLEVSVHKWIMKDDGSQEHADGDDAIPYRVLDKDHREWK